MQHIRLLAIHAGLTHNAVRRVLANSHAISHVVHTRLASTAVASSAKRTWHTAGVIASRASAVSTHLTAHPIRCEATVRYSRRVYSVGTRIA